MSRSYLPVRLGMAALLIAIWPPALATGQKTASPNRPAAVESNLRARKIVDAAIAVAGGREALRKIDTVSLKFEGELVHRNQSHRPEPPYERTRTWGELSADLKANKLVAETRGSWVGGFHWGNRNVLDGRQGTSYDVVNKRAFLAPENFNAEQARQDSLMQRFPFFALLRASDRERDLRYAGSANYDGRPHEVVTFPGPRGDLWTLYIDPKTSLVSKYEQVVEDAVEGDAIREVAFSGYHKDGAFMIPDTRKVYIAGELVGHVRMTEVKFNVPLQASLFVAPSGMPDAKPAPRPGDALTKFADNIYQFRTSAGYNVLLVGFTDHVFVMEAPGGAKVAQEIIAKAKELFPGKPVQAVAVTHFHDDHAGAAKGFMDANITLITTQGNTSYFKRIASIDSSTALRGTKIETVNGKRTLTDGQTTVELIDIGKGPHTDEMLIAYFPAQKLVFQGDLLNRPQDGSPQAGNDTTAHFAKRLRELGLDYETIAGVHGLPGTRADLDNAVQMYEARLREAPAE